MANSSDEAESDIEDEFSDESDDDYIPEFVRMKKKESSDESSDEDIEEEEEVEVLPAQKQCQPEPDFLCDFSVPHLVDHPKTAEAPVPVPRVILGKNGMEWKSLPYDEIPAKLKAIRRGYGKPKAKIRPSSPGEALKLFITQDIVDIVIAETNREAEFQIEKKHTILLQSDPNAVRRAWKPLTEVELWGFIGFVISAGVQKACDVPIRDLILEPRSDPLFHATFSVNRFEDIRRYMRFDDRTTRVNRPEMGKIAPIKHVFDLFLTSSLKAYEANTYITLDEQLLGFYGRTGFSQYILLKPAKFGIKIFWVCDAVNGYALTGKIYAGKDGDAVTSDLASKVTKELVSEFFNTGRTLTTDNYFTNLATTEFLIQKNLGVVGTMRKSRPELPLEFETSGNCIHLCLPFAQV